MRINENPFISAAGFNRSVYLPVIREVEPDAMGLFDYPKHQHGHRQRREKSTNVPSQALYLINSDYVHVQARRMGQRIIAAYPGRIGQPRIQAARVDYAFRLAYGRNASAAEQKTATDFFAHHRRPKRHPGPRGKPGPISALPSTTPPNSVISSDVSRPS